MAQKIRISSGDPKKKELPDGMYISKGRTPSDDIADIRDIVSGLAGGGYTSLSDDNARASFGRLRALLGDAQAQKLMTHVFIQNQRPEIQKMPVEARVKTFYEAPSGDAEVSNLLGKVKNLGYGVLPGFRESRNVLNQQLAGTFPKEVAAIPAEKIKIKVAPKVP